MLYVFSMFLSRFCLDQAELQVCLFELFLHLFDKPRILHVGLSSPT